MLAGPCSLHSFLILFVLLVSVLLVSVLLVSVLLRSMPLLSYFCFLLTSSDSVRVFALNIFLLFPTPPFAAQRFCRSTLLPLTEALFQSVF